MKRIPNWISIKWFVGFDGSESCHACVCPDFPLINWKKDKQTNKHTSEWTVCFANWTIFNDMVTT